MISWKDSDYQALVQASSEVGARPMDLLLVLYSESLLDPSSGAKDKSGQIVARGLNQITKDIATSALHMSEGEWETISSMTPEQNFYYVIKSLKLASGGVPFKDAGMLYEVNFAPARLIEFGSGDDVVLYSAPSRYYEANKGLDLDGKGYINVRDMRMILKRRSLEPTFLYHSEKLKQLYPAVEDFVIGFDEDYKSKEDRIPLGGLIALLAVGAGVFFYFRK